MKLKYTTLILGAMPLLVYAANDGLPSVDSGVIQQQSTNTSTQTIASINIQFIDATDTRSYYGFAVNSTGQIVRTNSTLNTVLISGETTHTTSQNKVIVSLLRESDHSLVEKSDGTNGSQTRNELLKYFQPAVYIAGDTAMLYAKVEIFDANGTFLGEKRTTSFQWCRNASCSSNSSSTTTQPPVQNTNTTILFSDTFTSSQLDTSKWEVSDLDNTVGDTYEIRDNKLRVLLPGGTDGYMGKSMRLAFSPKYNILPTSNISAGVTMAEINRAKVDGYKDNSGGLLCLTNRIDLSNSLCIGLMGNYSGYNPDGLNYPGWDYYDTYTGHRIFIQVANNGSQVFYSEVKLPELNELYTYDFKLYQHKGVWVAAYKEITSNVWNSIEVAAFAPVSVVDYRPVMYVFTGDGGYTRKTGSITMDFSQFLIEDVTQINPTNFTLTVNKPSNGEVVATNVACGSDCTENYPEHTSVTLMAKPAQGFVVDNWAGCNPSTDKQTCEVVMDSAKTVSVLFKASPAQPQVITATECDPVYSFQTESVSFYISFPTANILNNGLTGNLEIFKTTLTHIYNFGESRFYVTEFVPANPLPKPECQGQIAMLTNDFSKIHLPRIAIPEITKVLGKTVQTGVSLYQVTFNWHEIESNLSIFSVSSLQ
jgi:hypothetical protein